MPPDTHSDTESSLSDSSHSSDRYHRRTSPESGIPRRRPGGIDLRQRFQRERRNSSSPGPPIPPPPSRGPTYRHPSNHYPPPSGDRFEYTSRMWNRMRDEERRDEEARGLPSHSPSLSLPLGDLGPGTAVSSRQGSLGGEEDGGREMREHLETLRRLAANRPAHESVFGSTTSPSSSSTSFASQLSETYRRMGRNARGLSPADAYSGNSAIRVDHSPGEIARAYDRSISPFSLPSSESSGSEGEGEPMRSLGHSYRRKAIYSQNRSFQQPY